MFRFIFLGSFLFSIFILTGCPKKHSRGGKDRDGETKIPIAGEGGADGQGGSIDVPIAGTGGNVQTPVGGSGGNVQTPVGGSGGNVQTGGEDGESELGGNGGDEPPPQFISGERILWEGGLEKATGESCGDAPVTQVTPTEISPHHFILETETANSRFTNQDFLNDAELGFHHRTIVKWTPTETGVYSISIGRSPMTEDAFRDSLDPIRRWSIYRSSCTEGVEPIFASGPRFDAKGFYLIRTLPQKVGSDSFNSTTTLRIDDAQLNQPLFIALDSDQFSFSIPISIDIFHTEIEVAPSLVPLVDSPDPILAWLSPTERDAETEDQNLAFLMYVQDPNFQIKNIRVRFFDDAEDEPLPKNFPIEIQKEFVDVFHSPYLLSPAPYEVESDNPDEYSIQLPYSSALVGLPTHYFQNATRVEFTFTNEAGDTVIQEMVPLLRNPPELQNESLCQPQAPTFMNCHGNCRKGFLRTVPESKLECPEDHACRLAQDGLYKCTERTAPQLDAQFFRHPGHIGMLIRATDTSADLKHIIVNRTRQNARSAEWFREYPSLHSGADSLTGESGRTQNYIFEVLRELPEDFVQFDLIARDSTGLSSAPIQVRIEDIEEAPLLSLGDACDEKGIENRCPENAPCVRENDGEWRCGALEQGTILSANAFIDRENGNLRIDAQFTPSNRPPTALWFEYDWILADGPDATLTFQGIFNEQELNDQNQPIAATVNRYCIQKNEVYEWPESIRVRAIDSDGFLGEEIEVQLVDMQIEGAPNCTPEDECPEGSTWADINYDGYHACLTDEDGPTLDNLEIWLTDFGRNLLFDFEGSSYANAQFLLDTMNIINPSTSEDIGYFRLGDGQFFSPHNHPFPFEWTLPFETDEEGNFHFQAVFDSDFFRVNSNGDRSLSFAYDAYDGFFDQRRFYSSFNQAELRFSVADRDAFDGTPIKMRMNVPIQQPQIISEGEACIFEDFRTECEHGTVCLDPDPEVDGDATCERIESASTECAPEKLHGLLHQNPKQTDDDELYWELQTTTDGESSALKFYEETYLCFPDTKLTQTFQFTAPEAGYYGFDKVSSIGDDRFSIRTHCSHPQTELTCHIANFILASKVVWLEQDESVYVLTPVITEKARVQVWPFDPPTIVPADEAGEGQSPPQAQIDVDNNLAYLQFSIGYSNPDISWWMLRPVRSLRVELLDDTNTPLQLNNGETSFTTSYYFIDSFWIPFEVPEFAQDQLENTQSLRIYLGTQAPGNTGSSHYSDEFVEFALEMFNEADHDISEIAVGEVCDIFDSFSECVDGSVCGVQQAPDQQECLIEQSLPLDEDEDDILDSVCNPLPAGCELGACPAEWTVINLNDSEDADQPGTRWHYEGNLDRPDLEFHGNGFCRENGRLMGRPTTTGQNDLLSFTAPADGVYRITLNPAASHLALWIRINCLLEELNCYLPYSQDASGIEFHNVDEVKVYSMDEGDVIYPIVDSFSVEDRKEYTLTIEKLPE